MTTRFAIDRARLGTLRFNSGGTKARGIDEFKESEHPRAENGQFGQGSGSSAAPAPAPAPASAPAAAPAPAPAPAAPSATTFVSPNVGSGYNVAQGARRLGSVEQKTYMEISNKIDSMLGLESKSQAAVGAWSDGGENSMMNTYSPDADYEAVKASAAMKGLLGQQKAVVTFKEGDGGSRMHTMTGLKTTNPAKLSEALVAAGIPYHTLIKKDKGYDVSIFEEEASPEMSHAIANFARAAKSNVSAQSGSGSFIGSWDTREEGKQEYEKVINSYMESHPEKRAAWEETLANHKFRKASDGTE